MNGPIRVKWIDAAKSCEWNTLGKPLTEEQSRFIEPLHFSKKKSGPLKFGGEFLPFLLKRYKQNHCI